MDITSILQENRLQWYGHVLRKDDNDWVKKCMEYGVVGSRPRGRPKRTWLEVEQRDCQVKLNSKTGYDGMDMCCERMIIDWVKKCMEYGVVGSRPRCRPKRTWLEVVQKECQARKGKRQSGV